MRDESTLKLSGIANSDKSKQEFFPLLQEMLNQKGIHIVICVEKSTNALVGVSAMKLTLIDEIDPTSDYTLKTKEVAKLFEMFNGMVEMYDIKKHHTDKYYDDRGIIVLPDYRGFGVGSALVETRKDICKEHGVPLTMAWMTSIFTQKAGSRDGWETSYEIDSTEFCRKFDVTPYDGIAPTFKVMVKKVEL